MTTTPSPKALALKPCPFCGDQDDFNPSVSRSHRYVEPGDPELGTTGNPAAGTYPAGYYVECDKCGCCGADKPSEAEAIAAWNQRATPTDSGEVVQASDTEHLLAAWTNYDPPQIVREIARLRHAFFSGWEAFRDHRLAFSRPELVGDEALVERVAGIIDPTTAQLRIELAKRESIGFPDLGKAQELADERWTLALEKAHAAIQAIPAPATDAGQSADSGMAFTAMVGDHCPGQRIDSIDEFLRLINGGAKLFDVRLASLPKSPSAGEEA
jgi:Lar family restriction alleviation protein